MAIQDGSTVSLHYTGKLTTGEVFDTSEGRDPLQFEMGGKQVIPGFENGVRDMDVGEKKTITIPAAEAYGERNEEMIQDIPRERLQAPDLAEGQVLGLQSDDGRQFQATVLEMDDEKVKLDFNHFLAGKDLVFDLELVEVQ